MKISSRTILAIVALSLTPAPASAFRNTYVKIVNIPTPQPGTQTTFSGDFAIATGFTPGVKPTWTVTGCNGGTCQAATFIYSDSTQKSVKVTIPTSPTITSAILTITAVVPETPAVTVTESKTILIGP